MSEVMAYKFKKGDVFTIGSNAIKGKIKLGTWLYIHKNDGRFNVIKNEDKPFATIIQLDDYITTAKQRYKNFRTWYGYSVLKAICIVLRNLFIRQLKIQIIND